MPDLRSTRKKLKIAMAVMAGVDLLAVAAYFSPLIGSAESHRMQMNQLQAELTTKTRQVEPLRNLPQKVVLANRQIADFYKDRFPTENSQIVTEIGKLAAADNVTLEQAKYPVKTVRERDYVPDQLQPYEVEADFSGSYVSLAKFINAVERDQMFFIIDSITLGGQLQGPVKLGVKLDTYLKAARQ